MVQEPINPKKIFKAMKISQTQLHISVTFAIKLLEPMSEYEFLKPYTFKYKIIIIMTALP